MKFVLLFTFIGVLFLVFFKLFIIKETKEIIGDVRNITKKGNLFYPLYSYYKKNKPFPIISETLQATNPSTKKIDDKSILNVVFPDYNISYNVASFSSQSNIIIEYDIPSSENIYFFSLTIYLENGSIYKSISDEITGFGQKHVFSISPTQNQINTTNKTYIKSPSNSDTYCVIIRLYKININYQIPIPKLTVDQKEKQYQSITKTSRQTESNFLQKILYILFHLKFSNKNVETFFNVNAYKFFLPAKNVMSLVFPNEYATYLMTFPKQNKNPVLVVEGTLQKDIGSQNNNCRYVSFMASNFLTTATDDSINFRNIKFLTNRKYKLYVAFDEEDAESEGYNSSNDNLLLWNKDSNDKPVLIYRIVSVNSKHNDDDYIFTLPNEKQSIENEQLTNWQYYPNVINVTGNA